MRLILKDEELDKLKASVDRLERHDSATALRLGDVNNDIEYLNSRHENLRDAYLHLETVVQLLLLELKLKENLVPGQAEKVVPAVPDQWELVSYEPEVEWGE